jgi:O-antigen/teichoic acid export membrane protein
VQRVFVRNLAFLLLLNVLVKPVWILGVNVGVQNAVGPADYGVYFAVLNLAYIFQVFLDLGIQNFNNKSIAGDPKLYSIYLGNMALIKAVLGVLFFVLLFVVGKGVLGYSERYLYLLGIVGFNVFLSSFLLFLRSNLAGLHLFKWDSVASVADRVLMIVICGGLLIYSKESFVIEWFAYAQTISYALVSVSVGIVLGIKAPAVQWTIKRGLLFSIIKSSLPFALLNLLMASYTRLDGIMLERLLPDGNFHAGIYAQGFKFYEASTMIAFLFAGLLLPIFSGLIARNERVVPIIQRASQVLLVPVFVLVVASFFQSEPLANALFSAFTADTSVVLRILMLSLFPVSVGYIFGTLLTANGNLLFLNLTSLIGLVANILLNIYLIPVYQAEGAAWATLITQSVVLGAQWLYATKQFEGSLAGMPWTEVLVFTVGTIVIGLIFRYFLEASLMFWALHILLALGLALSLRILDLKEAFKLLK